MGRRRLLDVEGELLDAFRHSGHVNEYLVGILPTELWRADPPAGRGRSLAAIVAPMQAVRRTFMRIWGWKKLTPASSRR